MRKDNSRRNRNNDSVDKKSDRSDKSDFRNKKSFDENRKREEFVPFEKKKKYADRATKMAKNKRRFDFGQAFTNKNKEVSKESEDLRKNAGRGFKKNSIEDNRNAYKRRKDEEIKGGGERKTYRQRDRNDFSRDRLVKKKPFHFKKPRVPASGTQQPSGEGIVRLNKYIANSGVCSRREADDMITAGLISVNGEIVTRLGTKISLSDVVKYNNETLRSERIVYVLLNKPKDYITTADDPENRKTVMQLIADACKERIYPVGRLDRNTTGVLLFTNDGELTKRLTHPGSNIKKIYHVELDKNVKQSDLEKIAGGIELEDGMAYVDEIAYDNPVDKSHVGVELHSGKNRIVRRIFESLGYDIRKLDRVVFAGLTKKDLPRGRWRFLTEMEVGMLKMLTGKKNSGVSLVPHGKEAES